MSEELLRFIRSYSHDFQNHLQVISGLAQLNRNERIREYIGQVSGQIREISKIAKIASSEVAIALLAFYQQAARFGIPLLFEVKADLNDWPAGRTEERGALVQAFADLGTLLAFLEGSNEPVVLNIVAAETEFIFRVELPISGNKSVKDLEENLVPMRKNLEACRGRASLLVEEPATRIFLTFPR